MPRNEKKIQKQTRQARQSPAPEPKSSNTLKGVLIGLAAIGLVIVAFLFGFGIIKLQ
jgi:predicted lipid-binding transport protein (Tim44 family)